MIAASSSGVSSEEFEEFALAVGDGREGVALFVLAVPSSACEEANCSSSVDVASVLLISSSISSSVSSSDVSSSSIGCILV